MPAVGSSASSVVSRRPAAPAADSARAEMSVSYGGQAVLEGVMMRGPAVWSVAVRTPAGDVVEVTKSVSSPMQRHRIWRLPVIRGVIALGESLAIGFRALAISANYAMQPEGEDGEEAPQEV